MSATYSVDPIAFSSGLLIGRLVLGLAIAAHGAQKLFGWFGGPGLDATGGMFDSLGFRPGRLFALTAGAAEVAGGLLVTLGLFGPVGPALMLSVVAVAAIKEHWPQGFFAHNNGIELPLIYGVGAIVLALTGPGLWSLDALLGLDALSQPRIELVALLVALAGGIANVLARRPAQPVAQAAPQRG